MGEVQFGRDNRWSILLPVSRGSHPFVGHYDPGIDIVATSGYWAVFQLNNDILLQTRYLTRVPNSTLLSLLGCKKMSRTL